MSLIGDVLKTRERRKAGFRSNHEEMGDDPMWMIDDDLRDGRGSFVGRATSLARRMRPNQRRRVVLWTVLALGGLMVLKNHGMHALGSAYTLAAQGVHTSYGWFHQGKEKSSPHHEPSKTLLIQHVQSQKGLASENSVSLRSSSSVPPMPTTLTQANSAPLPSSEPSEPLRQRVSQVADPHASALASLSATTTVQAPEAPQQQGGFRVQSMDQMQPKNIKQLLAKTQSLHRIGGTDEAVKLLLSGIQNNPNSRELRAQLASLYLDVGQLEEAERTLKVGLRLDAQYMPYTRLMARILSSKQQTDEAIALLLETAASINEEPEHYSMLASLYQQKQRHDLASQLYAELLAFYPDNGRWWTGLGISLESMSVHQQAMESYVHALNTSALEAKLRLFANQRVQELSKRDDVQVSYMQRSHAGRS